MTCDNKHCCHSTAAAAAVAVAATAAADRIASYLSILLFEMKLVHYNKLKNYNKL